MKLTENNSYAMEKPGIMRRHKMEMPDIFENDVLLRIEYCGICGSDIHLFMTGRQGENVADRPMVLGHEASGTVVDIGSAVKGLAIGDQVAIEPGIVCGVCNLCKAGRYNLCQRMVFPSTPPNDGFFMNYVSVPSNKVFKLPDSIGLKEASLFEPLACGFNAARQGGVEYEKSVAIIGAGCIGLMTLLASRALGAGQIYQCDSKENRLNKAKELGATLAVNIQTADFISCIMDATCHCGVDIVIDCSGSQAGLRSTIDLVAPGGTVVMMGMPPEDETPYNFTRLIWKEVTIKSSFRYLNCYDQILCAIQAKSLSLDGIISHMFSFEQLPEAFDFVIQHRNEVLKAVVKVSD